MSAEEKIAQDEKMASYKEKGMMALGIIVCVIIGVYILQKIQG